jgi:hypothetical protein
MRRYIVSNDHSFKKAFIANLITVAYVLGVGVFINREEEDGKLVYNLRGPLKRFGTIEYEILKRPYG